MIPDYNISKTDLTCAKCEKLAAFQFNFDRNHNQQVSCAVDSKKRRSCLPELVSRQCLHQIAVTI